MMTDLNDPQGYTAMLGRLLKRLRDDERIDDESRRAIKAFALAHYTGNVPEDDQLSLGSIKTYTGELLRTAKEINTPLSADPVDELHEYLDAVSRRQSASLHNNRVTSLRAFSSFHGYGWADEISTIDREQPTVNEEKVFSDEELNAMLEEADPRGRALIALMADLGCRIGAACSFRLGALALSDTVTKVGFNTEANTKGAEGRVLLTWSVGHIKHYLDDGHPRPDDPDAPLLHLKQGYDDEDDSDDGALSTQAARSSLQRIGKRAGIRSHRLKPHNFRHTAVTRWLRQGYTVQQVVARASWANAEMLDVYSNITDEMAMDDLAAEYDLVDESEVATELSEALAECPRCETPIRRAASFCGCCLLDRDEFDEYQQSDETEGVTIDERASGGEPGVPGGADVWSDGAGDVLDEVPPEVLMRKLVEKSDVDPSDLLDS